MSKTIVGMIGRRARRRYTRGVRARLKRERTSLARQKRVAKKLGWTTDKDGMFIKDGYPDPPIYFLDAYTREYRGRDKYSLNGAVINMASYKGNIVLNVDRPREDEDAKAAARLGFRLGGAAWLKRNEFDDVITLLREAKRVWLHELRLRVAICKCKACRENGKHSLNGVCERHRAQMRAFSAKVKLLCTPPKKRRTKKVRR